MNADYVNSFVEASRSVFKSIASINCSLGKVYLKASPYSSDSIAIVIGLLGDIRGQVIISMNREVACKIASYMMMGMSVEKLDDISNSALCEAANIILGNAATKLFNKGIRIDITPPSLFAGSDIQVTLVNMKTLCVPIIIGQGEIVELNISSAA